MRVSRVPSLWTSPGLDFLLVLALTSAATGLLHTADSSFKSNDITKRDARVEVPNPYEVWSRLHGSLVQLELLAPGQRERTKRAVFTNKANTWPHRIPYQIGEGYEAVKVNLLRRVLKFIEDRLCLTFVNEPNFDPKNNDYDTNAYMKLISGNECMSGLGRGKKDFGPMTVNACNFFYSMLHELFHSLGAMHQHQSRVRDQHVSVAFSNLRKEMRGQFMVSKKVNIIQEEEYNPSSLLMYSRKQLSANGLSVLLPLREEEFDLNQQQRNGVASLFYDLNVAYRCRETYCNQSEVDCGIGYYTKVKGHCSCVCPEGFEPLTRCQTLVDSISYRTPWPDTDLTFYAGSPNSCPDGFEPGVLYVTGQRQPLYIRDQFFKQEQSKTTPFWFCSRNTSSGRKPDWERMPMGQYCVVKPKGVPCKDPFKLGEFWFESKDKPTTEGNVGDVQIKGTTVTMRYCCRHDRLTHWQSELPVDKPFRLIVFNQECQEFKGLRHHEGNVVVFVRRCHVTTSRPRAQCVKSSSYIAHRQCLYYPPVYGCSKIVTLNAKHRSHTISTPGFDNGKRESNRRCLYYFKVPPSSKMRVTFETFDTGKDDLFKFRRFNRWAKAMFLTKENNPRQVVTEKDFLFMEFWSSKEETTSNKGVLFTVDLILPDDQCYDIANRGENYAGNKSVSETMEACVPWTDAVGCEDFPWDTNVFSLLASDNECRNPGGSLLQPWCYVSVHGKMCQRRYCDVCNRLDVIDRYQNCVAMMASDQSFCSSALQRFGCAKSCGLPLNDVNSKTASCKLPEIPDGSGLTEPAKLVYQVGDKVAYKCQGVKSRSNKSLSELECRMDGWTHLPSSICGNCPQGWTAYGNRCWIWHSRTATLGGANKWCKSRKGALFKIRNIGELEMLRQYKLRSSRYGARWNTWINAKFNRRDRKWYTLDGMQPLSFFRWYSKANKHDPRYPYLYLRGENKREPGTFDTNKKRRKRYRFFCERPLAKSTSCFDTSASCKSTLRHLPALCVRAEAQATVRKYCQKTCGFCSKELFPKCSDPGGFGYHRVTHEDVVSVGQVMEFACNQGFEFLGGHLKRTCTPTGQLLGLEPICQAPLTLSAVTPMRNPVDINKDDIRRRPNTLHAKTAYLLDEDGFRIPIDGTISYWYYYATSAGNLTFLVYRPMANSSSYNLVGSNHVNVTQINAPWSFPVPIRNRIRVKAGDLFGLFSVKVKVAANACQKSPIQLMLVLKQKVNSKSASFV